MRTDSLINFNWGDASPGQGVPADGFSVRWTGSVRLPRDGKYTFYTVSDDGVRLWVDDQLVIDNWTDHGETENQGQIELWGARPHLIRLEYYENAGVAVAKLLRAGPGLEKQVIPTQSLFPDRWPESTKGTGLKGVYYAGTELGGTAEDNLPPGTAEAWRRMAKLGRGFMIWESNRTGNWRIWHRSLDGSDLRQVTPDETDRDHLAPHISPDGTRLVYLSVPHALVISWREDAPDGIPMYVISIDGSGLKQIAANARSYGGDREVVVEFDEPIHIAGLRVEAPQGIRVTARRAEKQRLILTLESELKQETTFGLSGISDLAQRPNTLSATNVVVHPLEWPTDRNGLVFAWRTAAAPVNAVNPASGQPAVSKLTRRNAARLDHNSAMLLNGGSCVATNAGARLLEACRASNALTIEATLTPANITQDGPARIVTFSSDPANRNFTLGQQQGKLILRLRTPPTGLNGTNPELIRLSKVPTLKEILPYREALMVEEYRAKQVVAGKPEAQTVQVAHWALLDGATRSPASRKPGWSGRLDLESFKANPQLKSLLLSDTLQDNFEATLYYDPSI